MRINQNPGFKTPDRMAVKIHNADTVTIPAGAPVVLNMNGTNNGMDVVLPSTSGSLELIQALSYGVNTGPLAVGSYGEAIVFGMCQNLLLELNTRANSSASWSTYAALSIGQYLSIDTVNNMWVPALSGYPVVSASTAAAAQTIPRAPLAILGTSFASYAGSASSTNNSSTAQTAAVNAIIRMM
jgi:hypothetical protein